MTKTLNVYSADIKLCATAYIRASSAAEARRLLDEKFGKLSSIDLLPDDITVSDRSYESERLPDASLSPTMTCYGRWGAPLSLAASHVNKDWSAN